MIVKRRLLATVSYMRVGESMEAETLALLEEYEKEAARFRENYEELLHEYEGKYVAIYRQRVVEFDRSFDTVIDNVSRNYPLNRVYIDFVTKEKLTLAL